MMSSGNKEFDRALAVSLTKLVDTFGVLPSFAFYDDADGMNAFAYDQPLEPGRDGAVLVGKRLFTRLIKGPVAPELAVVAACAHEFGHIVQFKRKLFEIVNRGQRTSKRSELQADLLAGYFAGRRKQERPELPAAVFATTMYGFGSRDSTNPDHHGTPEERRDAVLTGYKYATERNLGFNEALLRSTQYVMSL